MKITYEKLKEEINTKKGILLGILYIVSGTILGYGLDCESGIFICGGIAGATCAMVVGIKRIIQ